MLVGDMGRGFFFFFLALFSFSPPLDIRRWLGREHENQLILVAARQGLNSQARKGRGFDNHGGRVDGGGW